MDSLVKIYVSRSENEFRLTKSPLILSGNEEIKKQLEAEIDDTFYSAVISHAYYAMFYAAKALLLTKNIDTKPPEIHKKTVDAFKKEFVDTGILDLELLTFYKKMRVLINRPSAILNLTKTLLRAYWLRRHRDNQSSQMIVTADELLNILGREKWKRGHFTYQTIPQTNMPVAEESLKNAKKFLQNIFAVIKTQ